MDLKSIAEAYQSIKEKKLDPVGKEDGDVNNDGKKDSTDSYLMNRRKAIGKAMKKEAYTVTNADKKGNTPAYQGYKAGKKNVKTGEPLYKAAPHMKEHHQKDKDGNTIPHEDEIRKEEVEQIDELKDTTLKSYIDKAQVAAKSLASKREVAKKKQGIDRAKDSITGTKKKRPKSRYNIKNYEGQKRQYLVGLETRKGHEEYGKIPRNNAYREQIDLSVFEQLAQDSKEIDKFDAVIAYLIDENFAKDWDEAQKIMTNFKSEIIEEIYQSQLWTLFENREYAQNPEKYHDSKGRDKKLEMDKPYHKRSRAARMRDPERGINSPAFKKFMADRGM